MTEDGSSAIDHSTPLEPDNTITADLLLREIDLGQDPPYLIAAKIAYMYIVGEFGNNPAGFSDPQRVRFVFDACNRAIRFYLSTIAHSHVLKAFRFAAKLRLDQLQRQIHDEIEAARLRVVLAQLKASNT